MNGSSTPAESPAMTTKNNASGGWVVKKFGGTCVGKAATNIAELVVPQDIHKNKVAIVCSARSTGTKATGTTNRLLAAANEALIPRSSAYHTYVHAIESDHIIVGTELIRDPAILSSYSASVTAECSRLTSYLAAAQVLDEISSKTRDLIIGAGEKLACLFITALLQDRGIDAEYVNLENIIHAANWPAPSVGLGQEFYDSVATAIAERVRECGDAVPVITGFFGAVPGSLLSTVGRGYTDLCAALVAVGLDADEMQIWKEVDGIFTADPNKVPTASLIHQMSPEEAAELTYWGSEVIHAFTMEQAIRARIPIRIKNVFKPDGRGTVVFPDELRPKHAHLRMPSDVAEILKPKAKRPTAVTSKSNITVLNVHSNRKSHSHGFLASIFSLLDAHQLPVDLIASSEVNVTMALHATDRAVEIKAAIEGLKMFGEVQVLRDMAILSLVGKQMKSMVGIAGRMFSVLSEAGINIEMISQGASEINISCCVRKHEARKAMTVLHTRLFEYADD